MKLLTIFPIKTRIRFSERKTVWPDYVGEADALGQCDCDCSSDCACPSADASLSLNEIRLPFRDRDEVLDLILKHTFRHTILDAPVGYGKTHLLKEAKRRLESEQGYRCVIVNVRDDSGHPKTHKEIRQELTQGFEINLGNAIEPDAALVGALKFAGKFVLMFDSVDADYDGCIVRWLRESFAEPLAKTEQKGYQIILAGRHIQSYENPYEWDEWKPVRREVLQAIRVNHFEEILMELNPHINKNELRSTAEGMAWLSAGHPGIIENLVEEWRTNNYGQDFNPNTPPARLKSIFERRVLRCVEELLNCLGQEKARLLRIVCVFRQMDPNLLRQLFDLGLLDGDYQLVWSKIVALKLFVKTSAYWRDGVIRQMMARNLEILHPDEYRRFHTVALEIWEEQLPKLAASRDSFNHREQVVNVLRNILYHAINCGLTEDAFVAHACNNLLAIRQHFDENTDQLVELYKEADFDENDLHADNDWLEYLEIRHKPRPSVKEIRANLKRAQFLETSKQPVPEPNPNGGSNPMEIKIESKLLDSLARALDFLRQNAQNVLVERWEKRTLGKAKTPPLFQYGTSDETRQSLSSLPAFPQEFASPDEKTVVVNVQHIDNLMKIMENAQRSMDMFKQELANPLSTTEKVQVQHQIDGYQRIFDGVAAELADIFAYLYSR